MLYYGHLNIIQMGRFQNLLFKIRYWNLWNDFFSYKHPCHTTRFPLELWLNLEFVLMKTLSVRFVISLTSIAFKLNPNGYLRSSDIWLKLVNGAWTLQGGKLFTMSDSKLGFINGEVGGLYDSRGFVTAPDVFSPHTLSSPPLTLSNTSLLMSCKALDFQTFHWPHLLFVSSHQQVGAAGEKRPSKLSEQRSQTRASWSWWVLVGDSTAVPFCQNRTPVLIKS